MVSRHFALTSLALLFVLNDGYAANLDKRLTLSKGILAVVGSDIDAESLVRKAKSCELLIYVQSNDDRYLREVRLAAAKAGMFGTQIYVEKGVSEHVYLASNLADILVGSNTNSAEVPSEFLRVVHPGGTIVYDGKLIRKPRPDGADDWSHPYHGPDNNPQSRDKNVKPPYLTQFLTEPWYVPMPQVTVASGGRVFKAFGHIALKKREWPWLNSLVAINGYNGTHLWKQKLTPGFMVHRNNLIATPETLYVADNKSCRMLEPETGKLQAEIKIPQSVDKDGVWKWMSLEDETLFALVGESEPLDSVIRGTREQAGWPWSGLGAGYGGKYTWGFGRTVVAIDPETKKVKWSYHSDDPIDSRATCLTSGHMYLYSHLKSLVALNAETGKVIWKSTDKKMLSAVGQHDRAQTASKGFASSAYMKANEIGLYFAGPQRTQLVGVSATDGSLMWEYPQGNFQLVLRDDGLYAMGRMETSKVFDYKTGEILSDLQCYRGNCTRATATVDSIFTRGYRHTGTMRLDLSGNNARRIPLMRPACQDGVVIADGQLYWGPWMCDCNHSLVGMISLTSAGDFDFGQKATNEGRLETTGNALSIFWRPLFAGERRDDHNPRDGRTSGSP